MYYNVSKLTISYMVGKYGRGDEYCGRTLWKNIPYSLKFHFKTNGA